MPSTLEQFGLKSAINDICRQLNDGTKFICKVSGPHTRLEKYLELAVYRTVQELMMNVVKHAQATECHVQVIIASDAIAILVVDNGKGLLPSVLSHHGIGLASIRSKIKLLDGIITIDSTPDQATAVKITIPLADANRA